MSSEDKRKASLIEKINSFADYPEGWGPDGKGATFDPQTIENAQSFVNLCAIESTRIHLGSMSDGKVRLCYLTPTKAWIVVIISSDGITEITVE